MGSCRSVGIVKPKTPTQILSYDKTPLCNSQSVKEIEVNFLSLLFRELCIRNNSKRQLEKSIFLLLVPIPGMFGERLFDYYDKDKDGYIDEDAFLHIMEKFTKSEQGEVFQELFNICDLKSDNVIDKQEFTQTLNGVIIDILENLVNPIMDNKKLSTGFPTMKLENFNNSNSTLGSFSESIFKSKKNAETIIQEIFEKYAVSSDYMNFSEFKHLISSQSWLFSKMKESFRLESWENEGNMHLKIPSIVKNLSAPRKVQICAKVFARGKWVKKYLVLKDCFLIVSSEKKRLEQVYFIEGCHFKVRESSLFLIYSSQYDERIVFNFDTDEECVSFYNVLKEANPVKKFKSIYQIEEKIGYGKFSEVFRAHELENGQKWAVKIINKKTMNQSEREMIRKEVSILQNFSHPGIIKIKDVFDSHKNVKIVVEYCKGGDLLKKIKSEVVEEENVKKIIRKILVILQYLHSLGVIHRDIKPENILVSEGENPEIKLIDFGLSTFTTPGEIKNFKCGTLGYTAPEVFSGSYTNKVDLWSLGVITYAYLTGKLPFFSYSRDEMVELTKSKELDFTEEIWSKYSPSAIDFTKSLLVKNPELRLNCNEALAHKWLNSDSE